MKKNYKIGELSRIKDIDAQTLRYYDKIGILSPEIVDEKNNYRYYSIDQFIEVDKIKFYKILGLSLEEIKEFKNIKNTEYALETLKSQVNQIKKKIKKMQAIEKNISSIIETIENTDKVNNEKITIKYCDMLYGIIGDCKTNYDWYELEAKLLDLTNYYPYYSEIGHNHGLSFIYNAKYLHSAQNEHMEKILIPVDQKLFNDSKIEGYELGKCIIAYHKGPHHNIMDTLSKLKEYINVNKLKTRGDIVITTIISSFIVNNENEFLYEIKIPIINV